MSKNKNIKLNFQSEKHKVHFIFKKRINEFITLNGLYLLVKSATIS